MLQSVDVSGLSPQWLLFLGVLTICNALPLLAFLIYSILTAAIVFSSAAFVQLVAMVAGCAVLVPALLFASTTAVFVTFAVLLLRAVMVKLDEWGATVGQQRLLQPQQVEQLQPIARNFKTEN